MCVSSSRSQALACMEQYVKNQTNCTSSSHDKHTVTVLSSQQRERLQKWLCRDMLAFSCVWSPWYLLFGLLLQHSPYPAVHFWRLNAGTCNTPLYWVHVNTVWFQACHHSRTAQCVKGWPWYSNKPQCPLVINPVALTVQDKECGCWRLKYMVVFILACTCMLHRCWWRNFRSGTVRHVYYECLSATSCECSVYQWWVCGLGLPLWAALVIKQDSCYTSCLHYSYRIPVTPVPGVMNILYYQMSNVFCTKKASVMTVVLCLILIMVRMLFRIEFHFNSRNYVSSLSHWGLSPWHRSVNVFQQQLKLYGFLESTYECVSSLICVSRIAEMTCRMLTALTALQRPPEAISCYKVQQHALFKVEHRCLQNMQHLHVCDLW